MTRSLRGLVFFGVSLASALYLTLSSGAAHECSFEHAHYVLQRQPDVTADFREIVAPAPNSPGHKSSYLLLHIRIASAGWDYWYLPVAGSGYSSVQLISVNDPEDKNWHLPEIDSRRGRPHADQEYFALDKNLNFLDNDPYPPAAVPFYILVPDFGEDVWYDQRTIVSGDRHLIRRALFVFDHCD